MKDKLFEKFLRTLIICSFAFAMNIILQGSVNAQSTAPAVWTDLSVDTDKGPYWTTQEAACAALVSRFDHVEVWFGDNVVCMGYNSSNQLVGLQYLKPQCGHLDGITSLNSPRPPWNCSVSPCPDGYAFDRMGVLNGTCRPVINRYHDRREGACVGNPIYPLSGSKRESLTVGEWSPGNSFRLTYDTRSMVPADISGGQYYPIQSNGLGKLWSSNLHLSINYESDNQAPKAFQVPRGDGDWITFNWNGSAYVPDDAQSKWITYLGAAVYKDKTKGSIESFDLSGSRYLTTISYAQGRRLMLTYSDDSTPPTIAPAPLLLISVKDEFSRETKFQYSTQLGSGNRPLLSKFIDPDGNTTSFFYDVYDNLTSVSWPDSRQKKFNYGLSTFPWAMTSTADADDQTISTFGYDNEGRAYLSSRPGMNPYQVNYSVPPSWKIVQTLDRLNNAIYRDHYFVAPTGVAVTTPNQTVSNWGSVSSNGQLLLTSQSQPAGAGCAAASSSTFYDSYGLVRASVDFNGVKACFDNDATRRRETARLEGLNHSTESCQYPVAGYAIPAGSVKRKVSTQWHPDWDLIARQAEPKKITTWVYNGQPDPTAGNTVLTCAPGTAELPDSSPIVVLCKKVEQATTDATGSSGFAAALQAGVPDRIWQWTYNQYGQVLTEKDPLGNTTTSAYYVDTTADHNMGDLMSVTNAAGHVTQYKVYDKSGRLKRSIDANGVSTDVAYTTRGWVNSVTVTPPAGSGAAQTTSYAYDGVGQLKEATLPDATKITYSYDAAHRLVGIKDAAGNTITYTLDGAGNRTAETLKDPSGALARSLTRVYDALGRVQSMTGAQP